MIVPATQKAEAYNVNPYTVKNGVQTCVNLFLMVNTVSSRTVSILNIPLRLMLGIKSYQNRENWRIAFDVASFAALYWVGIPSAIAVDLTSEMVDFLIKYSPEKQVDPRVVLGFKEDQALDKHTLNEQYRKITDDLDKKIDIARISPEICEKIQRMKKSVEKAYHKLLQEIETQI